MGSSREKFAALFFALVLALSMGVGCFAAGGCLEGETMNVIYSSSQEFGDDDGTVRALAISYIKDVLGGTVNGDDFNYENWKLLTGVNENSAAYQKAVRMLNDGAIELHNSDTGRSNIRSISTADIGND